MKSFKEHLTESKKTYSFKIAVAGELPEGFQDHMKTCLQKFGINTLSNGKKTPIQERPLDFPNIHNTEVTHFEVNLTYPTTPQVLKEYLGSCCSVHDSHIVVRNPDDPLERYQEETDSDTYEVLLTKEDLGGTSAQSSVGGNRVMDLLKELEIARKERQTDPATATPKGDGSDIDTTKNTKAVVGG
jgi:hypothetical protein